MKKKYADDIFTKLNNGINTFFVQRRKPFGPIKLAKQKKDYSNEPTQTIISPSLLQQNISGSQNQDTQQSRPIQQAKVFKNIGNKISSAVNKIKDRLKNPFNKMKGNLKSDYDTFINDPSKQKNLLNAASKEDRQKVQEINAMVKASVNSGSSDTDIAAIRTRISSISNEQLKIQTKKTVDGIIERGGKDPEAKSMLGKALLLVLGLGKKFINGIISKIKTLSDKRNSFIMKSVDSGIAGMKQGAKTLKEGFMGSDQSKGIVKRVTDFAKPKLLTLKENVVNSKPAQALMNVGKKITDKFKQSNFGQGFMKATHIGETPAVTTHDKTSQSIADKLTYGAGTVFDTIVSAVNTMGDKISEWMNLSIDKKRNEASKKKKSKNPQTQKKQSTSFALGMIMGGVSSILSNVISMVAKIITSLKGFQALSKMLNDAIMKVAKPLNKAFQSLSKAIQKPLDIITDTLTKIVDSVSGILVSIVESIAPTLQSILPLVEMIVPIFKTIYDIQVEVVKVILAPVLSIFETTIGGDLKKSSNTQDSIKNTLTSTFGLVGQTLSGILSVVSVISQFLGGTIGDHMQTQVVMQQSSMMTEYGANQLSGTAQQKVALYNGTPNSTSTTSHEVGESARTNSSNKFTTNFGSPMDGIVGSGDFNAPYKFDENVRDAIMNLQEIASGITSLFTGGDTDVFKSVDKSTTAQKYQQAQYETASFTESEREAIDKRAFELFKNGTTTERLIGESDADYRARYEQVKEKYWAQAAMEAVHDKVKRVADGTDEGASSIIGSVLGTTGDKFLSAMDEMYSSSESGGLERMMKDYPMYSEEDMYYDDGGEYYDTGGSYYEGGTGDIFKAASEVFIAAKKAVGGDLKWNGTSAFNLKFDDGMVIDKISPTHCTSMMTAIVKRMGYYVPGNKAYTDTYQGTDQLLGTSGGHGSKTWGLQSSDGHPNIYNRDGSVSQDWIIVPKGQTKAGDITFGGIGGNIHAHMGAYQGAGGYWFGFNGGRDDSLKNSVRLAEYYLSHGTMPPSSTVGIQTEGKRYDQQLGAIAHPMSLGVRYVGPKTKGTLKQSASSMTSSRRGGGGYNGGSVSGDFKMRTTRPEAGNKYYIMDDTGGYSPAIKGKPTDPINNVLCNCVGYAMGRFFEIQGDPNFTHTFNANGGTPIYQDAIAKGFKTSPTPALGSMIVWNHPGGGGHVGIVENIGPDGSIDISQSGYGSYDFKYNTYTKESNYSNSSNKLVGFVLQPRTYSQPYSAQVESSTRAAARSRGSTGSSGRSRGSVSGNVTYTSSTTGVEGLIKSTAEVFEAYVNKNSAGTYGNGLYSGEVRTRSGHTRKVRPDCSGLVSAGIQEMGYTLKSNGKDVGDTGLRSWDFTTPTSNTIIYDSPSATTPSKDWVVMDFDASKLQRGDITSNYYKGHGGHVSMPIVNTNTPYPKGLDGGGTSNIRESGKAAKAYLDGSTDIPWRSAMGSGWSKAPMKIWRYVGGGSISAANQMSRSRQKAGTYNTASRSRGSSNNMVVSTGNVVGGNKALTAAAETMIAIKKAYGSAPTQGTWVSNVKFDDGMVIDGVSAMCTGTQAAIVKRMGYYLAPDKGKTYSSTYQGNHGMQWANGSPAGWGVNNADGHPNIFDRNGNKSQDWIISRDGSYQPGDISLPSKAWGRYDTTAWHAHMGAFKYKGKWYGFNGGNPSGSNAQTNKSINLANFYLQHGRMPTESDNININDYNASGGNQGIVIRYVGPQTGTRVISGGTSTRSRGGSTVATTGRSRGGTSGSTMVASRSGGNNSDWIRQVAMMFEGYYYNGDKVYDNGKKGLSTIHKVPMRDGRTVKVRPDCSGMLGGAISAFGYDLQYPPSSTHYNIVGYTGSWKSGWNPTYIKDANGNVSKDWEFWKIKDTTIQPGDILGREGHATFAVSGSGTNWRGMDAGGTSNIKESAKYAREYLDTGNTQWRGIKVSDMTNILRYVGGGGTTYYTTTGASSGGGRSRGGVVSTRTSSRSRGRSRNTSTNMNTGVRVTNPSAPLSGSSNQEKIFNYLTINKGMSPIGAAGMMGCFEHESNFKPNILENTYKQRFGYSKGDAGDIQYTNAVNTGKESEYNFVHSRGTNTAGYGIPQFTAPNVKQDLYDRTVKRGKSIDSIDSQMDSIMSSLTKSKYKGTTLANAISSASTPTEANQYFLWRYEAGVAYNSDAAVNKAYGGDISTKRHKSAEKWYRQFAGGDDYVDSLLIDDNFNLGPIEQFMTDPKRQGDLIYTDLDENIPYQKINGPMMIPALDVNGGIPQDNEDGFVIVNQINYTAQTYDVLFKHIDQVLATEYNVQSTTIRNLVEQINEEFPEYIDWYFSEDDGYSDEEFTDEDDMEILQMASNFI